MNNYVVAVFSVIALSASTGAMAAQDPTKVKSVGLKSSWYFGVGITRAQSGIPANTVDGLSSQLPATTSPPADFVTVDKKKNSTGLKAFLGYSFNRYFALEGGYAVLGNSTANMNGRVIGGGTSNSVSNFALKYKMSSIFLDAVGTLPLGEQWSLFGRLGAGWNRVSTDGTGSNGAPLTLGGSSNDRVSSKINVKFGAGVGYDFTPEFGVRAEWERYRMKDPLGDDTFWTDAATLSGVYRF